MKGGLLESPVESPVSVHPNPLPMFEVNCQTSSTTISLDESAFSTNGL